MSKDLNEDSKNIAQEEIKDSAVPQENESDNGQKKSGRRKVLSALRYILIIILLCIIVYEAYSIYTEESERARAVKDYEELETDVVMAIPEPEKKYAIFDDYTEEGAVSEDIEFPRLYVNNDLLESSNSDYIGWIYWDFDVADDKYDFTLNYPIVKENSKDEYLHLTYDRQKNSAGCIFMDLDSNEYFEGYSDFLFGHNMRNGSMFGSLDGIYKTTDKDTLEKEPLYVYIYTKDAVFQYVVYAYERTQSGNPDVYGVIANDKAYDAYVSRMKKLGSYKCPIDVSFDNRPEILNLSTCSGPAGTSSRLVIHLVKIRTFIG